MFATVASAVNGGVAGCVPTRRRRFHIEPYTDIAVSAREL